MEVDGGVARDVGGGDVVCCWCASDDVDVAVGDVMRCWRLYWRGWREEAAAAERKSVVEVMPASSGAVRVGMMLCGGSWTWSVPILWWL